MSAETAEIATITPEGDAAHVLVLGEHTFACKAHMPFGTMMKYAANEMDMVMLHHIIVKVVETDDLDTVWDAFDEVGMDAGGDAIAKLMSSYAGRPTEEPSGSSGGSKRTARR